MAKKTKVKETPAEVVEDVALKEVVPVSTAIRAAVSKRMTKAAAAVNPYTWTTGEVITADKLNALETTAANAHSLAETNEQDLGEVHNTLNAVTTDGDKPELNPEALPDGGIKAGKLSLGNGVQANKSTGMLEVPIDSDTLTYGSDGVGVADDAITGPKVKSVEDSGTVSQFGDRYNFAAEIAKSSDDKLFAWRKVPAITIFDYIKFKLTALTGWVTTEMLADGAVKGTKLAAAAAATNQSLNYLGGVATYIGKANVRPMTSGLAYVSTFKNGAMFIEDMTANVKGCAKPDNLTITVSGGVLSAAQSQTQITELQQGTVVTTFNGLRVSDIRSIDGDMVEGMFQLTNGTASDITIPADTVFLTDLAYRDKAASYTCFDVKAGWEPLTLEINATGKSVNFTTELTIPANSTKLIYVVSGSMTAEARLAMVQERIAADEAAQDEAEV